MSSFKNAEKPHRRTHKERGQLSSRKKYGLLEKHKDYTLRARDYNAKQQKLRILKQKARDRNPDEFYFKMVNTRLKDGRHFKPNEDKPLTKDELKLLKTQDLAYMHMKRQQEAKKVEQLESRIGVMAAEAEGVKRSHIIFVDDEKEAEEFDPAEFFNTTPDLVGNVVNRLPIDKVKSLKLPTTNKRARQRATKHRNAVCHELEQRIVRKEELDRLTQEMQLQKHLHEKGARKPIKDKDGKLVTYKWKYKRKR